LARSVLRNVPTRGIARECFRKTTSVRLDLLVGMFCWTSSTMTDIALYFPACHLLILLNNIGSCKLSILHHGHRKCSHRGGHRISSMVLSPIRPRSICHDTTRGRVRSLPVQYPAGSQLTNVCNSDYIQPNIHGNISNGPRPLITKREYKSKDPVAI
jgi:hypothetical protein